MITKIIPPKKSVSRNKEPKALSLSDWLKILANAKRRNHQLRPK